MGIFSQLSETSKANPFGFPVVKRAQCDGESYAVPGAKGRKHGKLYCTHGSLVRTFLRAKKMMIAERTLYCSHNLTHDQIL